MCRFCYSADMKLVAMKALMLVAGLVCIACIAYSQSDYICSACNGSGYGTNVVVTINVPCDKCNGAGKCRVTVVVDETSTNMIVQTVPCDKCKGLGYIEQKQLAYCAKCGGRGYVVEGP